MVGYNPRCKLCNCELRADAEKLHEEGASLQQVVDFLAKHDVTLSKAGVKRHFDTHFAPKDEAAQRYFEQSENVMEHAVVKRLTDLEMLDSVIERNYRLNALATENIEESFTTDHQVFLKNGRPAIDPETFEPIKRKYPPAKPIVELLTGTASEIRQAVKLKKDMLDPSEEKVLSVRFVDDIDDDG